MMDDFAKNMRIEPAPNRICLHKCIRTKYQSSLNEHQTAVSSQHKILTALNDPWNET